MGPGAQKPRLPMPFRKERIFGILTFTESSKVVLHGSRCYLDFRLLGSKKYRFWGPKTTKNLDVRTPAPMFTETGSGDFGIFRG